LKLTVQFAQANPAHCPHFVGVGRHRQILWRISQQDINQLVLGQAIAHIGAVFDSVAQARLQTADAKLFLQAALCAGNRVFPPMGVGAAGIRPQARRVIFARRPALQQKVMPPHHKDRNCQMAQSAPVNLQLFHRHQFAVQKGWNHLCHVATSGIRRRRCARFLKPILICAIGRAFTRRLFI
jgi:hypothetical protein